MSFEILINEINRICQNGYTIIISSEKIEIRGKNGVIWDIGRAYLTIDMFFSVWRHFLSKEEE